jgi:single-stranded-DNA-specific exonuclease
MAENWRIVTADESKADELVRALGIPLQVARILVARGVLDVTHAEKFVKKSMDDLVNPLELPGMKPAVERLLKAVLDRERILIHGDFDADGITSTALLTSFFREVGADVSPFVPNRLIEGHGISPRAIEIGKQTGVKIVVTCDCGTSSVDEIRALHALGIETIVTDHHAIPENLPTGAILVNPKLETTEGAHEDLSGVGVAFMLIVALRTRLRSSGFFLERPEPNLKKYLDIVALGTLADMASLRGQNRILVFHGLKQIANSTRAGIVAMREASGLGNAVTIRSDDVGFRLAPRINAAARLGHSEEALKLLLTEDATEASHFARSLETWNSERKALQEKMVRIASVEAMRQVQEGRRSIVVAHSEFHPGICGLVAQKLASEHSLPAFVFALDGETAKGSSRSRNGVNVVAAMGKCADLLDGFGGHEEAGGCTLSTEKLTEFANRVEKAVQEQGIAAVREFLIDAELNLRHLNEGMISYLEGLAPFGMGNPEPAFVARAKLLGPPREVGTGHLRVSLMDESSGSRFNAIGFGMWNSSVHSISKQVEIVYTPQFNDFQGRRSLQLRLQRWRNA